MMTGSLTSVTMAATFELEMDKATLSCIVGKTRDFPNLKINTNQELFLRLLTNCACGKRARLTDCFKQQIGIKGYLPLTLFAHHICRPSSLEPAHTRCRLISTCPTSMSTAFIESIGTGKIKCNTYALLNREWPNGWW